VGADGIGVGVWRGRRCAHVAFNTGIVFLRNTPNTIKFVEAWKAKVRKKENRPRVVLVSNLCARLCDSGRAFTCAKGEAEGFGLELVLDGRCLKTTT